MNKHVVSKPLAVELEKNGYPQESEFYWQERHEITSEGCANTSFGVYANDDLNTLYPPFAAPLSTELLEKLPEEVNYYSNRDKKDVKIYLRIRKFDDGFGVDYSTRIQGYNLEQLLRKEVRKNFGSLSEVSILKTGSTLPDALASMWIFLKEENLL